MTRLLPSSTLFPYTTLFRSAYNSAGDRVKMDVKQGATDLLTRYYLGKQYELDVQTNTQKLYLGGDAYSAPAIYVKEGTGSWKTYYILRDYLGSITHIAHADRSEEHTSELQS